MAEYIKREGLPEDFNIICTSDWHVGSKAHHDKAAEGIVNRLLDEDNTYAMFGGDMIEGKTIDSPHFNPDSLKPGQLNIQSQADHVAELLKPVAHKTLAYGWGNHELYLSRDFDIVKYICDKAGLPYGGYQTWVDLGYFRIHQYHGRASMPRGAKDPIQREANQRAWLVNRLKDLAGDCLVQLTGHTHALLVQPPLEQYALLSKGASVRGRYFQEPTQTVKTTNPVSGKQDVRHYIPPTSRWYANTGTLRRSGGFGYVDYSEVGGYAPSPIGYAELVVRGGEPVDLKKVVV